MDIDARTWIGRYAQALGTEPLGEDDITALLELAAVAAHSSERMAAPLSAWLAARSGMTPTEALTRARDLADSLGTSRSEPT